MWVCALLLALRTHLGLNRLIARRLGLPVADLLGEGQVWVRTVVMSAQRLVLSVRTAAVVAVVRFLSCRIRSRD